jgi:hypothetical protein
LEGPNLETSERWDPDRIEVKSDADPHRSEKLCGSATMPTTLKIILNCTLGTNNSTTRILRRAAVTRTIKYVLQKVKAEIFQGQVKVIFLIQTWFFTLFRIRARFVGFGPLGSGSFHQQAKKLRETLISTVTSK